MLRWLLVLPVHRYKLHRTTRVTGIAAGENKLTAMMGALRSRLINGLITNEYTAQRILETA